MTILTTAIQQALAELEKGDTLCEINAAHILRQALESTTAVLPTATGLPAQTARTWRGGNMTVADLVNNLLMMDQSLPIYGAQNIEHPQGCRRVIAIPPIVSCERVKDSRWIGEGDELNAAIIWTRVEQRLAPIDADVQQDSERLRGLHQMTTQSDTAASEAYQEAMEIEAKKVYDALNGRLELSTMQHYRQILDAGLNAARAAQGGA